MRVHGVSTLGVYIDDLYEMFMRAQGIFIMLQIMEDKGSLLS